MAENSCDTVGQCSPNHRLLCKCPRWSNRQSFSCPYHGWTYDLTGKLLNVPYVEDVEGFQPTACRLPAVKLDTWDGYLFINFDAGCESLASFLGDAPQVYGAYQCEKLRLAAKFSFTLDCNGN